MHREHFRFFTICFFAFPEVICLELHHAYKNYWDDIGCSSESFLLEIGQSFRKVCVTQLPPEPLVTIANGSHSGKSNLTALTALAVEKA